MYSCFVLPSVSRPAGLFLVLPKTPMLATSGLLTTYLLLTLAAFLLLTLTTFLLLTLTTFSLLTLATCLLLAFASFLLFTLTLVCKALLLNGSPATIELFVLASLCI